MSFIDSAQKANAEIFDLIKNRALRASYFEKGEIGAGGDKSAGIDLIAEDIFCKHLMQYGKIYSEESGEIGSGELQIYLDPIDGSDNFLSGFPYYGTSVALCDGEKILQSMVCNLANGDCYCRDGKGLHYINISGNYDNSYDTLNLNPTIGLLEKPYANLELALLLTQNKMKFRSPGAVALSLMYARRVGFVIFGGKIRDYDVKAGLHLAEGLYVHNDGYFLVASKDRVTFDKIIQQIGEVS